MRNERSAVKCCLVTLVLLLLLGFTLDNKPAVALAAETEIGDAVKQTTSLSPAEAEVDWSLNKTAPAQNGQAAKVLGKAESKSELGTKLKARRKVKVDQHAACNFTACDFLSAVLATYGDKSLQVRLRGHRVGKGKKGRRQRGRVERRMLFVGTHPCPIVKSLKRRRIFCYGVEAFHGLRGKDVNDVIEPSCRNMEPGSHQLVSVAGINQRLPFGSNHFSVGYAAFVLEHLTLQAISKALLEWKRVVQRGLVVAIRAFEGETDSTKESNVGLAKALPPPIMKSQEWWEGIFEDAEFEVDGALMETFEMELERTPLGAAVGLNQTTDEAAKRRSGKVFFLKKKRDEYDAPRDQSVQDIADSASEFDSRGTYREGVGRSRSEFDAREVHRTQAVGNVRTHLVNRKQIKSMSEAERKEAEDASLRGGSSDSAFSHDYWSKFTSNQEHSPEKFHDESREASHLKSNQVAEAREDLERLKAEEANVERYLKLGEKQLGEERKSLQKKGKKRRSGRSGRSGRRQRSKKKSFEKKKSQLKQVQMERESLASEAYHREAEIANSESAAVSSYRERHAAHMSRAQFIREEQMRLMSRNKGQLHLRHRLPVGERQGVVERSPPTPGG